MQLSYYKLLHNTFKYFYVRTYNKKPTLPNNIKIIQLLLTGNIDICFLCAKMWRTIGVKSC